MKINQKLPDIEFIVGENIIIKSKDLLGKKVIIYFYPKDNTPGCTQEAIDFSANIKKFDKIDVKIIGVSKDSLKKHENFKSKYNLSFPLASDENGKICEIFNVWVEKSMYGKKYMGIERSTFIFDEKLKLVQSWRNVKVKNHVNEVYTFLINKI